MWHSARRLRMLSKTSIDVRQIWMLGQVQWEHISCCGCSRRRALMIGRFECLGRNSESTYRVFFFFSSSMAPEMTRRFFFVCAVSKEWIAGCVERWCSAAWKRRMEFAYCTLDRNHDGTWAWALVSPTVSAYEDLHVSTRQSSRSFSLERYREE